MMRSFPENHIEIMSKAGKNKTIYRFILAENDLIANTKQKTDMANTLEKKGVNVEMHVYSSKDIDGTYIKTMKHGMGLSMRKFFAQYFSQSQNAIIDDRLIDFDFEHTLLFDCDNQTYAVKYNGNEQPICTLT